MHQICFRNLPAGISVSPLFHEKHGIARLIIIPGHLMVFCPKSAVAMDNNKVCAPVFGNGCVVIDFHSVLCREFPVFYTRISPLFIGSLHGLCKVIFSQKRHCFGNRQDTSRFRSLCNCYLFFRCHDLSSFPSVRFPVFPSSLIHGVAECKAGFLGLPLRILKFLFPCNSFFIVSIQHPRLRTLCVPRCEQSGSLHEVYRNLFPSSGFLRYNAFMTESTGGDSL